jgi:hypothetical protein
VLWVALVYGRCSAEPEPLSDDSFRCQLSVLASVPTVCPRAASFRVTGRVTGECRPCYRFPLAGAAICRVTGRCRPRCRRSRQRSVYGPMPLSVLSSSGRLAIRRKPFSIIITPPNQRPVDSTVAPGPGIAKRRAVSAGSTSRLGGTRGGTGFRRCGGHFGRVLSWSAR